MRFLRRFKPPAFFERNAGCPADLPSVIVWQEAPDSDGVCHEGEVETNDMLDTTAEQKGLTGLRVAAFESRHAQEMARLIERHGGEAVVAAEEVAH